MIYTAMASIVQLRNTLIDRLLTVKDSEVLASILKMLDATSEDEVYEVSDLQRLVLLQSESDIANGRTISQEDLDREDRKWLNQKQ